MLSRWPNSARAKWLAAKDARDEERARRQMLRPRRRPKPQPTEAERLEAEIHQLLEPLVQGGQVDVLDGIKDYLTRLRVDRSGDIPF